MTKQKLTQILSILLLPYAEESFLKEGQDFIQNARCYFALAESSNEKDQSLKKYNESEKESIRFFLKHTELNPRTLDDFRLLIGHYFSEKEIVRYYRKIFAEGKQDPYAIEDFYLRNIYSVARSLLTFRDGRIAIRTWINEREGGQNDIFDHQNAFDKVEIWNILNRIVVPDVFIAAI